MMTFIGRICGLEICGAYINLSIAKVQDDPKLLGDSGEVPVFEWSGWWFDSCYELFSLLDGRRKNL